MKKIPDYSIERELGQGGMATVYLAVQDILHRYIALKVMRPELTQDKNFRESFFSEATTIAQLEHPNIVRIHDVKSTTDGIFYMAMEYLSGGSLKDRLDQGKLSYSHSLFILEEVTNGLAYAHRKGYIHRDIKPANILFRDTGIAVLSDFGLAKLQNSSGELTRLGFTKGTVQYMSPEQAITTNLDQRSDIYSLGLVFYEMLTGNRAFLAESTIQAIHQHTTVAPPKLPVEYSFLQPVLDKVLAKEPNQRYQNVNDFITAVKSAKQLEKTLLQPVDELKPEIEDATKLYPTKVNPPQKNKHKKIALLPLLTSLFVVLSAASFGFYQYFFSTKNKNIPTSEKITQVQTLNENKQQEIASHKKNLQDLEEQKALEEARIKTENEARKIELAKQKAIEEEQIKKENEARKIELAKQKAIEEERIRKENEARKIELAKQKAIKEEQIKKENKARKIKQAQEEKKKREAKRLKQKQLAKQKAIQQKKAEKEKIRKAKLALAKKEKEAKEKKINKHNQTPTLIAKNKAQIKVWVTLNGRPLKTYIMVTKNGRRLQVAKGKSFATFTLPLGQYTVSANYNGKKAIATTTLEEGDIVIQKLSFRKSVQRKTPQQHPAPSPNTNRSY